MQNSFKNILIISISGMGTTILFTPFLKQIKEKYSDSKISILVGSESTKQLLYKNPFIDSVFTWDFLSNSRLKTILYLLKLRKNSYDLSITVYPNLRKEHNVISYILGAKHRLSHSYHNFRKLTFLNTINAVASMDIHDSQNNANLLECIGIKKQHNVPSPEIYLDKTDIQTANDFLKQHNITSDDIIIGARVGDSKSTKGRNWPQQNFVQLFDLLAMKNVKIIIFSTPQDRIYAENIISSSENKNQLIFENPNICSVASLIQLCSCFITDDSGLMHVASMVKTPIVALFGPTNKIWTKPLSNIVEIVETGIECSPCINRINPPTGHEKIKFNLIDCYIDDKFACMKNLQVASVYNAIRNYISSIPPYRT